MAVKIKQEADKVFSLQGFYAVARGFGVPILSISDQRQLPAGWLSYSLKYAKEELVISRLEEGRPVLEAEAVALDFLWERAGRLVRSMMTDYASFEITLCRQGEKIFAVNFVVN